MRCERADPARSEAPGPLDISTAARRTQRVLSGANTGKPIGWQQTDEVRSVTRDRSPRDSGGKTPKFMDAPRFHIGLTDRRQRSCAARLWEGRW